MPNSVWGFNSKSDVVLAIMRHSGWWETQRCNLAFTVSQNKLSFEHHSHFSSYFFFLLGKSLHVCEVKSLRRV